MIELKDKNGRSVVKGSIVSYKKGWVRVTAVFKNGTVNLGGIFNGRVYEKGLDLLASDIYEDEDAWYKQWQDSETYACM